MTTLLQALLDSPELQAAIAAGIVWVIVWVWKRVGKLPSGEAALTKRLVAMVSSVIVALAGEVLRASQAGTAIDWGRVLPVIVLAFLAATGFQTLSKRKPPAVEPPSPA